MQISRASRRLHDLRLSLRGTRLLSTSRTVYDEKHPIASNRAYTKDDRTGTPHTDSQFAETVSMATQVPKADTTLPSHREPHQPDYNAPIDHGTSHFSPVPERVMDGSEPGEVTAAAVLSGAPVDLQARRVRIYRPTKPATQSGTWHQHVWRMDWDIMGKGHRWENPLMGWQSSADFMQGTHLNFKNKDEAIHFAQKQGYEWFVQEPNERRIVPKAYANNFLHVPGKMKHIRTK